MAESVLLCLGLILAAAVAAAQIWMATGRALVVPARARTIGSWTFTALGAIYLGLAMADVILREPAGALAIRPSGLGAALLVISLAAFYSASWHLMWVLREDEQARRAGERAQRTVLAALRGLGVEPSLRGTGYADWRGTADKLDAGLSAGVFPGGETAAAIHALGHCRVLADSPSVIPLKLRAADPEARRELQDLQRITHPGPTSKTPTRR